MRIRVRVRVCLSPDGGSREDDDEEEIENGFLSILLGGTPKMDIQTTLARGTGLSSSAAVRAEGAPGRTAAAEESLSAAASAAERKARALGRAASLVKHQWRHNVWQNLADFWYFADAVQVPTIGRLKQQLLQSLLHGDFAVPAAAAPVLADLAHKYLCQKRHSFPQCIRRGSDVVLQLQGALLPDDQPLSLLEKGDHVELCFSCSSLPSGRSDISRALKADGEASTYTEYNCAWNSVHMLRNLLGSYNKECVARQGRSDVGCCGAGVCGCRTNCCTGRNKLGGKVVLPRAVATQKQRAAAPLQEHLGKHRGVMEVGNEVPYSSVTCVRCKPGGVAARLAAATQLVSPLRRVWRAGAKKKAKQVAHPGRKRATCVTVSTIQGKTRRSSTTSRSGSSEGSASRSSSESGNNRKNSADGNRERRDEPGALPRVTVKPRQGYLVPHGSSTRKAAGGEPRGAGLPAREKEKRCAAENGAVGTKRLTCTTTVSTTATKRTEAAAVGGRPRKPASLRKALRERVVQRRDTAAARPGSGVVRVQESSSELSSNDDDSSSNTEDSEAQTSLATKKAKAVPPCVAVAAAERQTNQDKRQAQQAIRKSRTEAISSEDSSSETSSTEESSSSSGEEQDAVNGRGALKGARRLGGRMPAAVARAAAASSTHQPKKLPDEQEQTSRATWQFQHQRHDQQEERRKDTWQPLRFKRWEDPSLAAVQAGEWLRVRRLQLVKGLPTLDTWKTVFVEAADVPAGRIKLWELRQRAPADGHDSSSRDSSSSCRGADGGSHVNREDEPSTDECTVHVPSRKVAGNQGGGPGRWCDWSELACISRAAAVEQERRPEATTSVDIAAAPATTSTSGSATEALPAGATTASDGSDNAGHARGQSTDIPRAIAAASAAAKAAVSAGEGSFPAEMLQRSSAPLRYLPRRLLSLRQQTPSGDSGLEEKGAETESATSHGATMETTGGTSGICVQRSSPLSSNSSRTLHEAALHCREQTGGSNVGTLTPNGVQKDDADSACNSLSQGKTAEASGSDTTANVVSLADVSSTSGQEKRSEAASSACAVRDQSQSPAATAEGGSCSNVNDATLDSRAAGRTTEKRKTEAGGSGGTCGGVSTAHVEKEQWEALISERLDIFFNEDEDALVASHPAAPAADFHLPLPRELVQECSRRLEAARHKRKNIKTLEQSDSTSPPGGTGTPSAVAAEPNALEINQEQQCEPCSETQPRQQQREEESCAKVIPSAGESGTGTAKDAQGTSSRGRLKPIVGIETWKDFACVKACARRVVGEQLQHIRRALRRQVDYYFSPENWRKDVYLRSRAVPLSVSHCNNDGASSCSSSGSSDRVSGCASDGASVDAQGQPGAAVTSTTAGTWSSVADGRPTAASGSSNCGAQKRPAETEAVGEGTLAINLDDIMAFPRMQMLSRDREFVAWCIRSGGGLQHVALERRGETHWLIRNVAAETALHNRRARKSARQQ